MCCSFIDENKFTSPEDAGRTGNAGCSKTFAYYTRDFQPSVKMDKKLIAFAN